MTDTLRLMGEGCRATQKIKHHWGSLISVLESGSTMIRDPEDVFTDTAPEKEWEREALWHHIITEDSHMGR